MRDPKVHAKVLVLRWRAVGRAFNRATLRGDLIARERLGNLQQRVIEAIDLHAGKTRWSYTPPSGRNHGFWTYTEIDDGEEVRDA